MAEWVANITAAMRTVFRRAKLHAFTTARGIVFLAEVKSCKSHQDGHENSEDFHAANITTWRCYRNDNWINLQVREVNYFYQAKDTLVEYVRPVVKN